MQPRWDPFLSGRKYAELRDKYLSKPVEKSQGAVEDLESLKDALRTEKQKVAEVASDRDRLKMLFHEKDTELQAALREKKTTEVRLAELERKLEETTLRTEKQKVAEVASDRDRLKMLFHEKDIELQAALMEKKAIEVRLAELGRKLEETTRDLATVQSTNPDLAVLLKELEELRAMKEMQGAQLAALQALYTEEQTLRKRDSDTIKGIRVLVNDL